MKRLSAFVLLTIMTALTISGGAEASYQPTYDFEAKLAQDQTLPVKVEKNKIDVPELFLTQDERVIESKKDCAITIKIIAGESNLDREARLAREEALAQAQAEAEAQARARARVRVLPLAGLDLGEAFHQLRHCESGDTYPRNSGNGYYGAYQFDPGTWRGYAPDGYADVRPDLAPPAIQDQAALNLYNIRGWQPWLACSRKLGLR